MTKNKIKILVERDPTKTMEDLKGIIKAPKGFNAVKAIEEMRKSL